MNATGRQNSQSASVVYCAQCTAPSGVYWVGWRAYRIDEPEYGEAPAVAFYCPTCARNEFGAR
jgi:hypothetical protein